MHWVAAISIVALAVSGLYIGDPYFTTGGEASSHYLMGRMRFIHFIGAAVIVMTGIVRVYWLVVGNRFERWQALFPITRKNLRHTRDMVLWYLRMQPEKQPHFVGHNPLAQWSYTIVYIIMAVMVLTGFALYGQATPGGVNYTLFNWVNGVLGGLQNTRLLHHALMWFFFIFVPIHVYLAFRADYIERGGVVSSILTGGRFVPSDEKFTDYDLQHAAAREWPHEG
jgi:Ni/Fe-hydrogenase 1 B-type cytochrome subunit